MDQEQHPGSLNYRRLDWGRDQELFYSSIKWHVRSEDIEECARQVGPNIKKIEACLRDRGRLG